MKERFSKNPQCWEEFLEKFDALMQEFLNCELKGESIWEHKHTSFRCPICSGPLTGRYSKALQKMVLLCKNCGRLRFELAEKGEYEPIDMPWEGD